MKKERNWTFILLVSLIFIVSFFIKSTPVSAETITINPDDFSNTFLLNGDATYNSSTKIVTLTTDENWKSGSVALKNRRMDLNYDFSFDADINIGDKSQAKGGADGIGIVLHPGALGALGGNGGSFGMMDLFGGFGFKVDTFFNSQTNSEYVNAYDPAWLGNSSLQLNNPFGAFMYTSDSGKQVYTLDSSNGDEKPKYVDNPDGKFKNIKVNYTASNSTLTITYNGITWKKNVSTWKKSNRYFVLGVAGTTGGQKNLQQVRFNKITYVAEPAIGLSKKVDKSTAKVGDSLHYSLSMGSNLGSAKLQAPVITDILPEGLSEPTKVKIIVNGMYIFANKGKENANPSGEYYTWDATTRTLKVYINSVDVNDTKGIEYDTTVLSGTDGEKKVNNASATASNTTDKPTASATVTIQGETKLGITKSNNKSSSGATIGDVVTYTVVGTNDGNLKLGTPMFTDTLPTGMDEPTNVKAVGTYNSTLLNKGKENANSNGEYYTWDSSTRKLTVYTTEIGPGTKKTITYDSKVNQGYDGEIKKNTVELAGINDDGHHPSADSSFKINAKANIKVIKKDSVTGQTLSGAVINWTDAIANVNRNITTGSDGSSTLANMSVNRTYVFKETTAPIGYKLNDKEYKVTLTDADIGKTKEVVITDDALTANIKIKKQDVTTKQALAGAEFEWKDVSLNKTGTVTTGADGTAILTGMPVNRKYEIKETKAPPGYELNAETFTVTPTVNQVNQTVELIVTNKALTANIKVIKKDSVTGQTLSGAVINWIDAAADVNRNITTGSDGSSTLSNMSVNRTYVFKETTAPVGYKLNDKEYKVTLTSDDVGKTKEVVITDDALTANIKIIKQDATTKQVLAGAEFEWKDVSLNKTGTVTTGADGTAILTGMPVNRKYEIKETKAPSGYELNAETFTVTPTVNQVNQTVELVVNNTALIPKIGLEKIASVSTAKVGDTIHYSLSMGKNTGNGKLLAPVITDILPVGMEKPSNIQINSNGEKVTVKEGKENGEEYYTWDVTTRTLKVYINSVDVNDTKGIEYDTKVLSGTDGEKKVNNANATASNTTDKPTSSATVTIMAGEITLHIKQEIVNKQNSLVVPTNGFVELNNVKVSDESNIFSISGLTIPSYIADTNQAFKTIKLVWNSDYMGYLPEIRIPELYTYAGYQLTTVEQTHQSVNRTNKSIPVIDYSSNSEYWLTVYIEPKTSEDGPPFYNWDYTINDFGTIKVN